MNRSGSCSGYSWEIEWKSRGGDILEIETDGMNLTGKDVNMTTTTVRDGGMWLRPIRGDMLRTPANTSQVIPGSAVQYNNVRIQKTLFSYV